MWLKNKNKNEFIEVKWNLSKGPDEIFWDLQAWICNLPEEKSDPNFGISRLKSVRSSLIQATNEPWVKSRLPDNRDAALIKFVNSPSSDRFIYRRDQIIRLFSWVLEKIVTWPITFVFRVMIRSAHYHYQFAWILRRFFDHPGDIRWKW